MAPDPAPHVSSSDGSDRLDALPHVRALAPHRGSPVLPIQLASNENPLGPSPLAIEAATRALAEGHRYPDAAGRALREALADRLGVSPGEIALGAGSNELVHLLIRAFCAPVLDEIVTQQHAFIGYRIAGAAHAVRVIETAVDEDLRCDVDALCAAFGPRTRLVILASPNNPTGAQLSRAELERIFEAVPPRALVVIDEAYCEYATALAVDYPCSLPYRRERPWLVTLRTFSKIYGLAGLRVGYAVADPRIVGALDRVRRPFHVSTIASAAARAALDDTSHVAAAIDAARGGLARLAHGLAEAGHLVFPTRGNFLLVRPATAGSATFCEQLAARGILVRPMDGWGLPGHVRISLGTAGEIEQLLQAL